MLMIFVTKAVPNTKIVDAANKIPDTSGLMIISVLNIKIGEVENKASDVNGFSQENGL